MSSNIWFLALMMYPLAGLGLYALAMTTVGEEEHRRIEEEERRRLGEDPPGVIVGPLRTLLLAMTVWPLFMIRAYRSTRDGNPNG